MTSKAAASGAASPRLAAPTPRRGPGTLDPSSANANAPSSPTKPTAVHAFCEGSYSGSWACGRPEGRGTYTSHLGSCFVGVWRRGWADGAGIYHWADGRVDLGRFVGEAERLPLLAAVGEGVRWSRDRSRASLLRNGVETEEISQQRAEEIAEKLGISPTIPPARPPTAHGAARVSKRELESLSSLDVLTKRQRMAIDSKLSGKSPEVEGGDGDDANAMPFETLWALLCPKP